MAKAREITIYNKTYTVEFDTTVNRGRQLRRYLVSGHGYESDYLLIAPGESIERELEFKIDRDMNAAIEAA